MKKKHLNNLAKLFWLPVLFLNDIIRNTFHDNIGFVPFLLFPFLTFCFAYILLTILISFTTGGCNQHYFSYNFLHVMFIILTTDTLISK